MKTTEQMKDVADAASRRAPSDHLDQQYLFGFEDALRWALRDAGELPYAVRKVSA
jgi:hypothetical protein